jgi:hypothetical protein
MVDAFGIHLVSGMFLDELNNLVCLLALSSNGAIDHVYFVVNFSRIKNNI